MAQPPFQVGFSKKGGVYKIYRYIVAGAAVVPVHDRTVIRSGLGGECRYGCVTVRQILAHAFFCLRDVITMCPHI